MVTETISTNSKDVILDAAEHLIAEHGYAGLSMRELSKHSGVAKSTLYHYFQDKREIYLSVLERDMTLLQRQLTEAAAAPGRSVSDRLRAIIETYVDIVSDRGIIALNALRRAGEFDGELSGFFHEHRHAFMQPFRSILQDGIDQGVFRADLDIDLSILSLVGMMNSFYAQRLLFECGGEDIFMPPRDEIIEHTLSLYLQGIAQAFVD